VHPGSEKKKTSKNSVFLIIFHFSDIWGAEGPHTPGA
jgi:hypothetical protein